MNPFINVILLAAVSIDLAAAASLEKASVLPINLAGNDIVFDATRNVLYLSVPSAAGFPYGNCVVSINPTNAEVIHSTFVGSEPNKLAISPDGSRVYIGLDGAESFCWWEPATDSVSAPIAFTTSFSFGPFVATDFAISPNDPHTVAVSKDDVSSSAAGDLEVFHDDKSVLEMNLIYGAESICFSDANTLIGYNNYTTGYDLWKWAFNGTNLTQTGHASSVIAGFNTTIKAGNGLIFSNNGKVVAASTLSPLGTFSGLPGAPAVEPMGGTNVVYFLGLASTGGSYLQLAAFDPVRFLKFDSKTFTNVIGSSMRSLVAAGHDPAGGQRLAFIQLEGHAGIISIPLVPLTIEAFQSSRAASQLTLSSDIGHQYQVQWSTDLSNWTTFLTTNATQFHTTLTFGSQGTDPRREFYRVVGN